MSDNLGQLLHNIALRKKLEDIDRFETALRNIQMYRTNIRNGIDPRNAREQISQWKATLRYRQYRVPDESIDFEVNPVGRFMSISVGASVFEGYIEGYDPATTRATLSVVLDTVEIEITAPLCEFWEV